MERVSPPLTKRTGDVMIGKTLSSLQHFKIYEIQSLKAAEFVFVQIMEVEGVECLSC
jgi:hypothetical protein